MNEPLTLAELRKQVEEMREKFRKEHPSKNQNWLLAFDADNEPFLVIMDDKKEKVD